MITDTDDDYELTSVPDQDGRPLDFGLEHGELVDPPAPHHRLPAGCVPEDLYARDLARCEPLNLAEQQRYARLARQGDAEAFRIMVESHLRLVVKIARRYRDCGVPLRDLIEEGNLGLIHAVQKFDPDRGFRLSS